MLFITFLVSTIESKSMNLDSMERVIARTTVDSIKLKMIDQILVQSFFPIKNRLALAELSIKIAEKNKSKSALANGYKLKGRVFWANGLYDSALYYHFQSRSLYQIINDKLLIADLNIMIGQDYANSSRFDSAIHYLNIAMQGYININHIGGQSYANNLISWTYYEKGDLNESIKYKLRGIKLDEASKDTGTIIHSNFDLAETYIELKKYKEAEQIFDRWEQFVLNSSDDYLLNYFYEGKAELAYLSKNEAKQLYYNQKLWDLNTKIGNNSGKGTAMWNLGNLYFYKNDYSKAIQYYDSARTLFKTVNQIKTLTNLNFISTICYIKLGKLSQAKAALEEGIQHIQSISSKTSQLSYYEAKYLYDSCTSNWKSAFIYSQKFHLLQDSIYGDENQQAMFETKMEFDLAKKENEFKNYQLLFILGLLFVCLFSALILYFNHQLNKRNKKIQKQNEILNGMIQEIHHRVKNNLQLISSYILLHINKVKDLKTKNILEDTINNIEVIALIHENLYKNDVKMVNLKDYIFTLNNNLISALKPLSNPKNELVCDEILLSIDKTIPLGLIINELITNSIKHAFEGRIDNKIFIELIYKNNIIYFQYSDNGKGFDESKIAQDSIGVKLIKMLVEELQGSYTIQGENGFRFNLQFEKKQSSHASEK